MRKVRRIWSIWKEAMMIDFGYGKDAEEWEKKGLVLAVGNFVVAKSVRDYTIDQERRRYCCCSSGIVSSSPLSMYSTT